MDVILIFEVNGLVNIAVLLTKVSNSINSYLQLPRTKKVDRFSRLTVAKHVSVTVILPLM